MQSFRRLSLTLLATMICLLSAAEPTSDNPELIALRREFEKRTSDALRPVFTWYEGELGRLERSATTRGNLDAALAVRQERERFKADQAQSTPSALKAALDDTRWQFNGDDNIQIVFKKDGLIECTSWSRAGWSHRWQVSGTNTVTYVVVRGPYAIGKQGTLIFTPDLKSFQGNAPDGGKIAPSTPVK